MYFAICSMYCLPILENIMLKNFAIFLLVFAVSFLGADNYKVDSSHAFAAFKVKHLGVGYTYGTFGKIRGEFKFNKKDVTKSTVKIEILAASVHSHNSKRDDHLRGPDFFDVKQFPLITFVSKSFKPVAGKKGFYEVSGNLTLRGKTIEETVIVEDTGSGNDPWGNFRQGFEAKFSVNRLDYGVNYSPEGIGRNVELALAVEGIRQK